MSKLLIVTGPFVEPQRWFPTPEHNTHSSLPFFQWIWSGMGAAVMGLFGPPCRDNILDTDKPVDLKNPAKHYREILDVEVPVDWPLTRVIQVYLDSRKACPYFPRTSIRDSARVAKGGPNTAWLYLDPINHPDEGRTIAGPLSVEDPTSFLYWPQRLYDYSMVPR